MTAAFEDAHSAADKVDAVPELEETVACRMTLGVQAVTKMAPSVTRGTDERDRPDGGGDAGMSAPVD